MKRKLFSAILFGALLTASTSGLTSCKDYDDDISNLQSQIDKLATADQLSAKVSEMKAAIDAAQSAAEAKAAAAQTVADAAKAAAADAAAAASKAQSTADGATQAAKDAAAAAAAANEVAKAAQAAVDKLAAEAATKAELEAAAEAAKAYVDSVKKEIEAAHAADKATIEKAIADSKTELLDKINANTQALGALDTRLTAVEAQLEAIIGGEGEEASLEAIAAEVEAIGDALEDLIGAFTMATCVDLYKMDNWDTDLKFWNVTEVESVFPTASQEPSSDADATVITDGKKFEFTAGKKNVSEDSLLVRVNPVDADLNAEGVSLKLVNSQGLEIPEDLVKVVEIKRYTDDAPMTKAADGNGLWIVKFKANEKLAEKEIKKQFEEYTMYNGEHVAFAIAIDQDFESAGVDRRMVTAYDIALYNDDAKHAAWPELSAASSNNVKTSVARLTNRFKTNDKGLDVPRSVYEKDLKWKTIDPKDENGNYYANTEVIKTPANKVNVQDDNRDGNNNTKTSFFAKAGEKIRISFPAATPIKGFYVTLDWKRANESGTSEITAWNNYTYVNVAKMDPSTGKVMSTTKLQEGNNGYITIKSIAPNVNVGDIIGFRVFAVNLDGSLVDPDGQAFYVAIKGEEIAQKAIDLGKASATVTTANGGKVNNVESNNSGKIDFSEVAALGSFDKIEWTCTDEFTLNDGTTKVNPKFGDNNGFVVRYYNADDEELTYGQPGFFFADVDYIIVHINNAQTFADGYAHTLKAKLSQAVSSSESYQVGEATLKLTKVMPTVIPDSYKVYQKNVGDEILPKFIAASSVDGTLTGYASSLTNFALVTGGSFDANGIWKYNDQTDKTGYTSHSVSGETYKVYNDGTDYTILSGVKRPGYGTIDLKNIFRFDDNTELQNATGDKQKLVLRVCGVEERDVFDKDYYFAPKDIDAKYNATTPANSYIVNIAGQYFNPEVAHAVKAVASYNNISLKMVADSDPVKYTKETKYEVAETVGNLKFMPWSYISGNFMRYEWTQKCVQPKSAADKNDQVWVNNNEMAYETNIVGATVTKMVTLHNIQVYFGTKNNSVRSTCVSTTAGQENLAYMLCNQNGAKGSLKVANYKGKPHIWTESANGRPDEFFKYKSGINSLTGVATSGDIQLEQVAVPNGNTEITLCIEVVDAYGYHSVIRKPIVLVANVQPAYASDSYNESTTETNPIADRTNISYYKRVN